MRPGRPRFMASAGRALCAVFLWSGTALGQPADMVLSHGTIYTLDEERPWAESLAIARGRLVYVGDNEGADAWIGPETQVMSLGGAMVLPGFHDSHVHPATSGLELTQCYLGETRSKEEVFAQVKLYADKHRKDPWIVGGGWSLTHFPEGEPNRETLDRLVPDRPAFLTTNDAHTAWVNSRALSLSGIDHTTPDPPGGKIERDQHGHPTGLLREEAIGLVSAKLPPNTVDDYVRGLRLGLDQCARYGITSLIEANAVPEVLEAYQKLESEGHLTARVVAALSTDPKKGASQVASLERTKARVQFPTLKANSVKLFADGVVESKTALLLEPYDHHDHRGLSIWEPEIYLETVAGLHEAGFQIHIHAIGDGAVRDTLNAIEGAQKRHGVKDLRHQIAHLQLIQPADLVRFRELGVVANVQPLWAYNDEFVTSFTIPYLGPTRSQWLYPIGALVSNGTVVVGGSDWSVSSINPLLAIQVAVTRTDPADSSALPLTPQYRVDLPTILAAYTINGAYGMHQEAETGSLQVGKWADLVVLEKNLFTLPPEEIGQVKVLRTILGGRTVYERESDTRQKSE